MIRWSLEEALSMLSQGRTIKEITKHFGFKTTKSVYDKIPRELMKTPPRKPYSEDFMDELNSEWKAYFLGLMLTDGWVTQSEGQKKICLSLTDQDAVEYIAGMIGCSVCSYPPKEPNHLPFWRINLSGEHLADRLAELGVVERKSYHIPDIQLALKEMKYLRYVVRGIIDGDGTIGFPTNSKDSAYFRIVTKSENFAKQLCLFLEVLSFERIRLHYRSDIFQIEVSGRDNIQKLAMIVYAHPLGMARKRKRLLDFVAALPGDRNEKTLDHAGNPLELIPQSLAGNSKDGEVNHFENGKVDEIGQSAGKPCPLLGRKAKEGEEPPETEMGGTRLKTSS